VAEVAIRRDGPVLWITLDRPEALNALSAPMNAGLAAALEEAADATVRAVVLTGAGGTFCAGQDSGELRGQTYGIAERIREQLNANVLAIRRLRKPVIAAIAGRAAGAGLSLALACDVRIAAGSAVFAPGLTTLGLAPDPGTSWLATRLLGAARGFEWLTTGRELSAEDAREWGLVSEVLQDDELAGRAAEVARLFAAMPTLAVAETKQLLDRAQSATLEQQLDREVLAQAQLVKTDDFAEGVAAFVAGRPPSFTGASDAIHPVRIVITDDLRRWRLTVALRGVLVLPHLAVLAAWWTVSFPVWCAMWVLTLIRGEALPGLHGWLERLVRYDAHVCAYWFLVADPFPSFRGWAGTYPIDVAIDPPAGQPRWSVALRPVLGLPALVFTFVLMVVVEAVSLVAWFAALATARTPRGMRDLMAYCLRYQAQTYAYLALLTSRYPSLAGGSGYQYEEA
jgi:2-(1,2-epoxy-1,2-dihydrophenyl)acetyl-CoA isomerase